ncbi:DUF3068 domain-containing protein [Actinoplanes couchii]|uniref:DUF3068 domain-containing protein n=1 Tax=Actinoplanes couchii TaxID=403638 RepID=A0ABQ3XFE4_9ACTN|nr:DUF3068 domain-containing protein [Actinoplanes couchii]MDR6321892.1 hypothetical protein [Actinoplanes couchii]GID57150.1 hypothetical protein Aco03nite_055540 [Actinoplanes couchii]
MKRIIGTTLFGLGILSLLLAIALAWVVVPSQRKVPLDLVPPDVVVEDTSASFVQAKVLPDGTPQVAVQSAGLRSATGIKPDFATAAQLDGDTLIWNVYHATSRSDTNEMINRSESRVALDRVSGAAVPWDGQCHTETTAPCAPISFAGQLYLFPFGTEKRAYQYWDSTLGKALPIGYQAEERFNGLATYRFQQQVPEQPAEMDAETLDGLLGFLAPEAATGSITYRATRTLWVEPRTGAIVGYREQQNRTLVPDTGTPVTIFDADLQYDQATLDAVRTEAQSGVALLTLLGLWVPSGLAVLGLVLIAAGFLLSRSPRPRGEHRADETTRPLPTPVPS